MILRQATPADAAALCDVINPIIAKGGTTAYGSAFTPDALTKEFITVGGHISCTMAEDETGCLGFQVLFRAHEKDDLPEGWALIGSYVRGDAAGKGVGRALFDETKRLARAAGIKVIDATIRGYNAGGLAFYNRMGFVDWKVGEETVSKRYDL